MKFVSHSLVFVSLSLLVLYEHVLGSFQIRFQFVMSSLDDHVRRIFSVCVRIQDCFHSFAIRPVNDP